MRNTYYRFSADDNDILNVHIAIAATHIFICIYNTIFMRVNQARTITLQPTLIYNVEFFGINVTLFMHEYDSRYIARNAN